MPCLDPAVVGDRRYPIWRLLDHLYRYPVKIGMKRSCYSHVGNSAVIIHRKSYDHHRLVAACKLVLRGEINILFKKTLPGFQAAGKTGWPVSVRCIRLPITLLIEIFLVGQLTIFVGFIGSKPPVAVEILPFSILLKALRIITGGGRIAVVPPVNGNTAAIRSHNSRI